MITPIVTDTIDDEPDEVAAEGFVGFELVKEPTQIGAGQAQAGLNMWCDVDLLLQTRPGLRFNTLLTRAELGAGAHTPRGAAYYDIPGFERVLAVADGKFFEIATAWANAESTVLAPTANPAANVSFAQLIATMFWSDGVLHHSTRTGGAWVHDTVTTFSGGGAMPTWGVICAHNGRLLAHDPATNKIHASAIAAATLPANWAATENIIVGDGVGDPLKMMISGQNGLLIVVNERSAWAVDTSAASVADWTATRITNLAGTREGRTVVQAGQDIIYLSAFGVVSLGALATSDSINPQLTLSAPVQTIIDRINGAAIGTAWSTMWRALYVLAVALDDATTPNCLLCYNTQTRQWAAPWMATLPDTVVGETTLPFAGFVAGAVTNFADQQETLVMDNTGRVLRLDKELEYDEPASMERIEIESWATMRAFTHELRKNYKQPFLLTVEWFNSTGGDVQVNLVRDGVLTYPDMPLANCEVVASGLVTNALKTFPIRFPFQFLPNRSYSRTFLVRNFPRYLNAAVQVHSARGTMKIRAVRLTAFIDPIAIT